MRTLGRAYAAAFSLLVLSACSSGGGGSPSIDPPQTSPSSGSSGASSSGSSGTSSSGSSGASSGSSSQTSSGTSGSSSGSGSSSTGSSSAGSGSANIGAPAAAAIAAGSSFPAASGSSPNFTTSLPANGTAFPLLQTELATNAAGANGQTLANGATITFSGTQLFGSRNQPIYELKIPDLGVDATPLQGNGAPVLLSDGRELSLGITSLNYSLYGAWSLTPATAGGASTDSNLGIGISGYQTPSSAVPTGSATYVSGANGVFGYVAVPSGSGAGTASLQGQASVGVNFATGAVSGSLTNMTVTPEGGSAAPWNNVSLSGNLSGSTLSGATASSGAPPAGTMSFDASSTGTFNGSLFGPHAEELGASWSLHDTTGQGKSAIGYIGATKQ